MTELFIDELVRTALQLAAPVIAALVVAVLAMLAKRLGLQIKMDHQARIEKCVQDAILLAEERVAEAVKRKVPITQSKVSIVVEEVRGRFPNLHPSEVTKLIKQELPKLGFGASAKKS